MAQAEQLPVTLVVLGTLAFIGSVVAAGLWCVVWVVVRRKGVTRPWVRWPGIPNIRADLRKIIQDAETPEERLKYQRWRRVLYVAYGVLGVSAVLTVLYWISLLPYLDRAAGD
jgi:hypothetical protein